MTTETVTVAFVNAPKDGKAYGSIKTQDGKFISVHGDKLGQFQKGGSYVVEYETTEKGYHNFKRLVSNGNTPQAAPAGAPPRADDLATAERIFVCGAVNNAVAAGHSTDWPSLVALVNNLRNAFAFTFGGRQPPQPHQLQQVPQQQAPQYQPLTGGGATGYAPMAPTHTGGGPVREDGVPFAPER